MNMMHIHKLFDSSLEGWDDVARIHPTVMKLFGLVVLPLSLIPPLMLEYAGRRFGATLYPDTAARTWDIVALLFLVAELLTVPLMAWGIKLVANSGGIVSDYHEAFTLAAIAPIPLWLSALGLFSGNLFVIVGLVALGLAGSVVLIFRGMEGMLKVKEGLLAFDMAFIVTALGLIAWMLLIMLVLVPIVSG